MRLALAVSTLIAVAAGAQPAITFRDALALAEKSTGAQRPSTDVAALRRTRYPDVRAEVSAGRSRTLDVFAEPLSIRSATGLLTFDYPLFDGGARGSRVEALEWRLGRIHRSGLDDGRFARLVDAFGDLYLAQKQLDLFKPIAETLSQEAGRTADLVAAGDISNITAVERREIALGLAGTVLELEARRGDAAARLQLLTGVEEEPQVVLDPAPVSFEQLDGRPLRDDWVDAASMTVEESEARLEQIKAANGFQAMLSGSLGVGAAESEFRGVQSDGTYGVYGLRVHLSYPLLGWTARIAVAEARADLQQAIVARDEAREAARLRAAEYLLRRDTSERRLALLRRSVEVTRQREESLQRLVEAGVRTESELAHAAAERTRREGEIIAAEVERWKAAQLLARMAAPAEPEQANQP